MENMQEFLDRWSELEDSALNILWESLDPEDMVVIEKALWSRPEFLLEGRRLLRRKKDDERDLELSKKAKKAKKMGKVKTRSQKREKRAAKANKIFKKLRRSKKELIKEAVDMESFGNWLASKEYLDDKVDSRGPNRILLLTKDGTEGLKKLEEIARGIYRDLGVQVWIEESRDDENKASYGLFTALRSYGPEELDEIQKSIKKVL